MIKKTISILIIGIIITSSYTILAKTENETNYFGVVVVALDETLKPHIYDGLLSTANWKQENIQLLWKTNATKDAIINSLIWLKNNADENDIVLFSFDGHGSYINNTYGIWSYQGGDITVEELDYYVDQINAKEICLIFDCCFSGTFVESESRLIKTIYSKTKPSYITGLEEDNRIILMSTMKKGLGSHWIDEKILTGEKTDICFSSKLAEAWEKGIDKNNDGICSAEESFTYAKRQLMPLAIFTASRILLQIFCYLAYRHIYLPFPTIYDTIDSECPIVTTN